MELDIIYVLITTYIFAPFIELLTINDELCIFVNLCLYEEHFRLQKLGANVRQGIWLLGKK